MYAAVWLICINQDVTFPRIIASMQVMCLSALRMPNPVSLKPRFFSPTRTAFVTRRGPVSSIIDRFWQSFNVQTKIS